MSNTVDAAFLAAATYALVQWIIKPLIVTYWLPQSSPYQDNVTRLAGYLVAYALTLINQAVTISPRSLTFTEAWDLLPTAAAIYASSSLVYHIGRSGTSPAADTQAGSAAGVPAASPAAVPTSAAAFGQELQQLGAAIANIDSIMSVPAAGQAAGAQPPPQAAQGESGPTQR